MMSHTQQQAIILRLEVKQCTMETLMHNTLFKGSNTMHQYLDTTIQYQYLDTMMQNQYLDSLIHYQYLDTIIQCQHLETMKQYQYLDTMKQQDTMIQYQYLDTFPKYQHQDHLQYITIAPSPQHPKLAWMTSTGANTNQDHHKDTQQGVNSQTGMTKNMNRTGQPFTTLREDCKVKLQTLIGPKERIITLNNGKTSFEF